MSRVKEEFFDAELEPESVAWKASPEGRAEQEKMAREWDATEAASAYREVTWESRHPHEWKEWMRVRPLVNAIINFGEEKSFDFDDFLKEVGRQPSPKSIVVRKDETQPYQQRNMVWATQAIRTHPSPYLTVDEAAAYCRRSRKTILNHHWLGNLRSIGCNRPLLFRIEDLDVWLSARRKHRRK